MLPHTILAFVPPTPFGTRTFHKVLQQRFNPLVHQASSRPRHFSSPAPTMTAAKLVTAQWLSTQIDSGLSDEMILLDVRGRVKKTGGRVSSGFQATEYVSDDEAFFGGHIPGARFVDWLKIDVARHTELCDMLSLVGVQREKPVCVYDWGDMIFATRLWFALSTIGCQDVSVLNGGWHKWDELDGPVSLDTVCPLKSYSDLESTLNENEVPSQSVTLEEMRNIVMELENQTTNVVVIDARSTRQYSGEECRASRAGHIPGAVNVPYRTVLNKDGIGLLSDDELRIVFQEHGLRACIDSESSSTDFVIYCNGGVSSTVVMFGLARCGVPVDRIRNYCGSFNEWDNLEDTPLLVNT